MRITLTIALLCIGRSIFGQSIYSAKYESQAVFSVYVVNYESQADLVVFKVDYRSQADGNEGVWFFEEYQSQADKVIFFTTYES